MSAEVFYAIVAVIVAVFVFALGYFMGVADASEDAVKPPIGERHSFSAEYPNSRAGEIEFSTAAARAFKMVEKHGGLRLGAVTVLSPEESGMPGRWYAEAKVIGFVGPAS